MRWILVGCIVLMIPLISAVINFFINKNLIERKIRQVNTFMLKNIQYSIDAKLEDIQKIARQYQLDEGFSSYALNVKENMAFLRRVENCYRDLVLSRRANPNIETMIYIPGKEYILDSTTANTIENIYGSLQAKNRIAVSLEEWKTILNRENRNELLITEYMSYANCGTESLVYSTPMLYSDAQNAGWIYCSIPTDFIEEIMASEVNMNNTILIVDENQNIIGQYGTKLQRKDQTLTLQGKPEHFLMEEDGETYVGAYADSDVADWKYVVCTPEWIYMEEIVRNRNINLLIVFLGAVIGILSVIIMEKRNFQPVRKLMNILPEREELDADAFAVVEKNLQKLFHENQFMQNAMETRKEYDRELSLLSAIKGGNSFFRKLTTEEMIGDRGKNSLFCFATVKLDTEEERWGNGLPMDYDLLVFLIQNIIADTFGELYPFIKTVDDRQLVYLFVLETDEQKEAWRKTAAEKFMWVNEFFQNRLELDLPITIGEEFDSFEDVETAYGQIQEANEQRYYTQPLGVIHTDSLSRVDFASMERLKFYSRRFENAAAEADFAKARELEHTFFEELEQFGSSFSGILYYVLSIVNTILMVSPNMMQDEVIKQKGMEEVLTRLRRAESISILKEEYDRFWRLICRAVDEENRDGGQLSEKIKTYVNTHYQDCNVNISAIAQEMDITPRYMSKLFYDQTGVHLLSYINDVRIAHAKILLKTTGKTVDEIAWETGFANTRTFRRNFQKATGVTARDYKNS